MKKWVQGLGVLFLSIVFTACSSGSKKSVSTNSVKVQQEYQRLKKWADKQESIDKMLVRFSTGNDETREKKFMQHYRQNLKNVKKSAAKLNLTDRDVKRLRDIYLELLVISESTMPVFVHSNPSPDMLWKLQSVTPKLNKLEQEFEYVEKRVKGRFRK